MPYTTRPLHPRLGVEIEGCDLSVPLSDAQFAEIRARFDAHSVVVIPGQRLTPEAQVAFLRRFGEPKISQRKEFHLPGTPEIGKVGNVKNPDGTPAAFLDRVGDLWHTDTSSDAHIDAVTMLYCVRTPEEGGDTLFCSMHDAYDTLPADLRERIAGRTVVHSFNKHNDALLAKNPGSARPLSPEDRARWPDRVHAVVQRHPVTGRTHYFVTPSLAKTFSGMDEPESAELAQALVQHATRAGSVYRHKWRVGDLVFWDNRAAMHSATPANYRGGERLMHRAYAYTNRA
jgi:taurine dioxygenase